MADNLPIIPPVTIPNNTGASATDVVKILTDDAAQVEKEAVAIAHAYKAGGATAVMALLPSLASEGEKIFGDVLTAAPTLKASLKTGEFIALAAASLGIGVDESSAHPMPQSVAIAILAGLSIYAAVRMWLKSKVVQPPLSVTSAATIQTTSTTTK